MHPRSALRVVLVVSLLAAIPAWAQDVVSVSSPDGKIQFRLLDGPPNPAAGTGLPRLSYQVDFNGKRLIDTSYLGFDVHGQLALGDKLGLMETLRETKDETYTLPAGKAKTIRNHYNQVTAEFLQNGSLGRRMTMEIRAFDDGVAFRYFIPVSPPLEDMIIDNENTQFVFAKDAESYPLLLRDFTSGYADQYSKLTLSGIHPEPLIGLPFLVRQPGVGWVAITEADVDEYPGMYLSHVEGAPNDRTFKAQLSPTDDGSGWALHDRTPIASPWRVLLINENPAKLLESNIVTSLNAPSKLADISWIKPGKTALVKPAGTAAIETTIDRASAYGFEYVTVEAGWAGKGGRDTQDLTKTISAIDLQQVLAHATQKNVGVWLSADWKAIDSQMEEAFALFEKWGVRGVAVDLGNRDDVWMVNFYRKLAQTAANHHLMLSYRGGFKPDGMNRTFPNVLTREAAMGSDSAKTSARVTPDHDVMLAYTRLLAGSIDYRPVSLDNATREQFVPRTDQPMAMGTRAHQLALHVVLESPLQAVPEVVSNSLESPNGSMDSEFIKFVPATWDETRGIVGEVGEYIAVARRHGDEWFVGAITNWTARDLTIPLSFLGAGNYSAITYSDAADADFNPSHTTQPDANPARPPMVPYVVSAASNPKVHLASGGGIAIHLRPIN